MYIPKKTTTIAIPTWTRVIWSRDGCPNSVDELETSAEFCGDCEETPAFRCRSISAPGVGDPFPPPQGPISTSLVAFPSDSNPCSPLSCLLLPPIPARAPNAPHIPTPVPIPSHRSQSTDNHQDRKIPKRTVSEPRARAENNQNA
jgi:hypothetical protein